MPRRFEVQASLRNSVKGSSRFGNGARIFANHPQSERNVAQGISCQSGAQVLRWLTETFLRRYRDTIATLFGRRLRVGDELGRDLDQRHIGILR